MELTYPYFHDGEAATLTKAMDIMGRLQLGRQFSSEENAQTGDQPSFSLPILPPSTYATPRPTPFE